MFVYCFVIALVFICFSFQVCVFACLYLCGFICVQVQSLHMCAYMYACMSVCRLLVDVKHLPFILFFFFSFGGSVSQSRPVKLTDTAITSKIVLAILYPILSQAGISGGPLCSPAVH